MGDLSTNFSRHEFACKCGCGADSVDYMTLLILEDIRDHFRRPVIIHSAHRCADYNQEVGGADHSQHPLARAVDFSVDSVHASEVQAYLKLRYPGMYGIGSYSSFTHIDTRTKGPARWDG